MHATEMLSAHPQNAANQDTLAECIKACFDCAQICTSCADACLSEGNPEALRACIRSDMDCADVCETTGRLLSRQSNADDRVLAAQLKACHAACSTCAEECNQHRDMHQHCKVCADACRACAEACEKLLDTMH